MTYNAPAASTTYSQPATASTSSNVVLPNGNTAGATGSYAAAPRMAELTGVPASTWEHIIARESNGQVEMLITHQGASGLSKLCQVGVQQQQ